MGNIIVFLILSILVAFILRYLWAQHKSPKQCTGNCSSCGSESCHLDWQKIRQEIKETK